MAQKHLSRLWSPCQSTTFKIPLHSKISMEDARKCCRGPVPVWVKWSYGCMRDTLSCWSSSGSCCLTDPHCDWRSSLLLLQNEYLWDIRSFFHVAGCYRGFFLKGNFWPNPTAHTMVNSLSTYQWLILITCSTKYEKRGVKMSCSSRLHSHMNAMLLTRAGSKAVYKSVYHSDYSVPPPDRAKTDGNLYRALLY